MHHISKITFLPQTKLAYIRVQVLKSVRKIYFHTQILEGFTGKKKNPKFLVGGTVFTHYLYEQKVAQNLHILSGSFSHIFKRIYTAQSTDIFCLAFEGIFIWSYDYELTNQSLG